jgi:hypothetical protein
VWIYTIQVSCFYSCLWSPPPEKKETLVIPLWHFKALDLECVERLTSKVKMRLKCNCFQFSVFLPLFSSSLELTSWELMVHYIIPTIILLW